jgi:hypothetical protein
MNENIKNVLGCILILVILPILLIIGLVVDKIYRYLFFELNFTNFMFIGCIIFFIGSFFIKKIKERNSIKKEQLEEKFQGEFPRE